MESPHRTRPRNAAAVPESSASAQRGAKSPISYLSVKHLQGFLFVATNDKEFVQSRDLKHFPNLRIDAAQNQLAARRLHFLVQGNELAQGGTRHVFHVAKVQEQFFPA